MPTRFVGGPITDKEARRLWKVIRGLAKKEIKSGRQFTTGVTVGSIRRKVFPVDAGPGDPTQIGFVVNVRLIEFPGQPLAVDVLVANQARQLVSDAADETNTPVMVQIDTSGNLTVTGRALINTSDVFTRSYHEIDDVDGLDLSFLMGLETCLFSDLSADVQAGLNAYRAALAIPLPPLAPGDTIIKDPVIYFHGPNYWPGYIDPLNSHRFGGFGSITCKQSSALVPWNDPRWVWGGPPTGWGVGVVSWGLTETTTVCV
jgi:hypothetical protein